MAEDSDLAISLANVESATPTFLAPTVDEDRLLTFELSVSDGGVTTSDTMTVLVQAPGSDGKPAQVVSRHGKPSLLLPSGNYQIKGQFDWTALPMSLDIPGAYAQVILSVNGKPVDFPKTVNGELWFGRTQIKQTDNA